MKPSAISAAVLAIAACLGTQAQLAGSGQLPETRAESLAERPLVLPRELPAERTLVLLAFEREQRPSLATWKNGLDLLAGKTPWIELVAVGPQNAFVHAMIVRGLRREIPEGPVRDRTLLGFDDQQAYAAALGVSMTIAHVITVDRTGHVLAVAEGDYSAAKAQPLLASLKP